MVEALGIQLTFTRDNGTLTIVQSGSPNRKTLAFMIFSH